MEIKSVIVWPQRKDGGPSLQWADGVENISEDTNHSPLEARNICETLLMQGFGCDGHINGIYPIEARVVIDGEVVWSCKRRSRPVCTKPELFDRVKNESIGKALVSAMIGLPSPKELESIFGTYKVSHTKEYPKKVRSFRPVIFPRQ